jgi:hypothetical protein
MCGSVNENKFSAHLSAEKTKVPTLGVVITTDMNPLDLLRKMC